jgi:hypothetical protein
MNILKNLFSSATKINENQINVIKPYKWNGLWVFDDEEKGLVKEALVGGMPKLIEMATQQAGIESPEKGFVAIFSKDPFPNGKICLEWVRSEIGGNVYRWQEMEGWLCPALLKYFSEPPKKIYVDVKAVD